MERRRFTAEFKREAVKLVKQSGSSRAQWLLVLWGYWVDKHRRSVAPRTPSRRESHA